MSSRMPASFSRAMANILRIIRRAASRTGISGRKSNEGRSVYRRGGEPRSRKKMARGPSRSSRGTDSSQNLDRPGCLCFVAPQRAKMAKAIKRAPAHCCPRKNPSDRSERRSSRHRSSNSTACSRIESRATRIRLRMPTSPSSSLRRAPAGNSQTKRGTRLAAIGIAPRRSPIQSWSRSQRRN